MKFSGKRVREIRLQKNLTQMDVAVKTGLSLLTIGNIERGVKEPKISTIISISDALGVPVESFCEKGGE